MSPEPEILRLAAFTDVPEGGNPAGVVLDASTLDAATMQAIATDVGYSETAFLTGGTGGAYDVRYFSPAAEVPFCGHATIATAVALAQRDGAGDVLLRTRAGPVAVRTATDAGGATTATLTSVHPEVLAIDDADVDAALTALRWNRDDLDPALPPRIAFAGARHLVLAAATRRRLAELDYDFAALESYMSARDLTTVDLVWREDATTFHARNPFPVGGVVEDPATGAAAAAFGAYLRELGAVQPPVRITVHQGDDMGRPSRLLIDLEPGQAAVQVTGGAVRIAPVSALEAIAAGLWRWTARHPDWHPSGFGAEVASFALTAGDELLLLDPLMPDDDRHDAAQEELDGLAADASAVHVLITIPYHVRSAEPLAERYDARIWGPPKAINKLEDAGRFTPVDPDAEPGPAGVQAFAIGRPQRSERPLWIPSHHAIAFGDALVTTPDGDLRLWAQEPVDDRRTAFYRDRFVPTLAPLRDLPAQRILTTHGAPILTNGRAVLATALDTAPWHHRG